MKSRLWLFFSQLCLKYQGEFSKKDEKDNWPTRDLNRVKHLSHIVLGGSLCTKGVFGTALINTAQIHLKSCGINQLSLHKITEADKRALLGAFSFIK